MAESMTPSGLQTPNSDLNYDHIEAGCLPSPATGSEIGLRTIDPNGFLQTEDPPDQTTGLREFSLPPVDGGKDAWLCLVGGFILEMMVWGMLILDESLEI